VRRLGGRRWQALHRSVYAIAILAVLHYSWMVKIDQSQPLLYGGILAALLGFRVAKLASGRSPGRPAPCAGPLSTHGRK